MKIKFDYFILSRFDPDCLRRRAIVQDGAGQSVSDKGLVELWTNHRVMEWLRQVRFTPLQKLISDMKSEMLMTVVNYHKV